MKYILWVQLIGTFKVLVNRIFKEICSTIFMKI